MAAMKKIRTRCPVKLFKKAQIYLFGYNKFNADYNRAKEFGPLENPELLFLLFPLLAARGNDKIILWQFSRQNFFTRPTIIIIA